MHPPSAPRACDCRMSFLMRTVSARRHAHVPRNRNLHPLVKAGAAGQVFWLSCVVSPQHVCVSACLRLCACASARRDALAQERSCVPMSLVRVRLLVRPCRLRKRPRLSCTASECCYAQSFPRSSNARRLATPLLAKTPPPLIQPGQPPPRRQHTTARRLCREARRRNEPSATKAARGRSGSGCCEAKCSL